MPKFKALLIVNAVPFTKVSVFLSSSLEAWYLDYLFVKNINVAS